MIDYRAGKSFRLKHRTDITRVFDHGQKKSDGTMTLMAVPNPTCPHARFAVLVSKRHGPAVQRNRIKRLCREAFRLCRPELPDRYDYVILPRVGAPLTVTKLQDSLRTLAPKVTRQQTPFGPLPPPTQADPPSQS